MKINNDVLEVLWKNDKIVMVGDNGDWEYNRLGVVDVNGKVGIFDCELLEDGEVDVSVVKSGLSIDDVLELGVESGYLIYDENKDGELRVDWVDEDVKYKEFVKLLGV